ncbi:MAG: phosphoribosyltransferase [Bacillota bacterium]
MFVDRKDAGIRLASAVKQALEGKGWFDPQKLVVFGIPRGGVVVAAAVARHLGCPLHVVIARKIGHPLNPELAVGAVAQDGSIVVDPVVSVWSGISEHEVSRLAQPVREEVQHRIEIYRANGAAEVACGRIAVVVDDGIATGITIRAALGFLRGCGAARAVVGVPVAPRESIEELRKHADLVVCLESPGDFLSVGQWYLDFSQVRDEEVLALLNEAG